MGVDTKILISYGILIPTHHGEYIQTLIDPEYAEYLGTKKMDNLVDKKLVSYAEQFITFSSDGYTRTYNEMFIHLQSCETVLFNERTRGNGGYGKPINSEIQVKKPSKKDKEKFNTFCNFIREQIKQKFPDDNYPEQFEPNTFVYYYNW